MSTTSNKIWFREPQGDDNSWAERAEHTLDWLARSKQPRATACRHFLNHNLPALPEAVQSDLVHSLRSRWKSAFFELIVMRTLQVLGATIMVEVANTDGKKPDVVAQFPDETVTVEAISPAFDGEVGDLAKQRIPLLDFIELVAPEGWSICVWDLPTLGPSDSRKDFNRTVRRMLAIPPPTQDAEPVDLYEELPAGHLHLRLLPQRWGHRAVVVEPALTTIDTSEGRIRYAVKRKRRQVRNTSRPVLLAIEASGISSEFEDFDTALFGRTRDVLNRRLEVVERQFLPNGDFASSNSETPTYAGVLAFLEVGFRAGPDPILYLHPRFAGRLPERLLMLEQRHFIGATGIRVEASRIPGFRESMGFVTV